MTIGDQRRTILMIHIRGEAQPLKHIKQSKVFSTKLQLIVR
jgi:hypothetical protein